MMTQQRQQQQQQPPSATTKSRHNLRATVCDIVHRYLSPTPPAPCACSSDAAGSSEGSSAANTSSPVNKRRGFSSRKWIPPPLRKLSQGKVDKPTTVPPLKKTGSEKRFDLPFNEMSKSSVSEVENETGSDEDALRANRGSITPGVLMDEGEDETLVELPPPMKPIQDPTLLQPVPPSSSLSSLPILSSQPKREQHNSGNSTNQSNPNASDSSPTPQSWMLDLENAASGTTPIAAGINAITITGENYVADEDGNDSTENALRKRAFAMNELIETEKKYVEDLKLVCEGYLVHMRDPQCPIAMPEALQTGKDKIVFGNIETIYEWHRDCLSGEFQKCLKEPEALGPLFRRYERKLHIYVVYCQNKPMSEYIVSEYIFSYFEDLRKLMGHKLQLSDLLIKPVQRIQKYHLLVNDVLKHSERAGCNSQALDELREAVQITSQIPKVANDMMDVGRLQGFDGKITSQGKLLLRGPLMCIDSSEQGVNKPRELQVFLFEQSIIFSEAVGKKTQFTSPSFNYKTHILVNKMTMDKDGNSFVLNSYDPRRPSFNIIAKAPNTTKLAEWVETISNIIQNQRDFLKALQSPIAYQNKLTKDASKWPPYESDRRRRGPAATNSRPTRPHTKANTIDIPTTQTTTTMTTPQSPPIPSSSSPLNHKCDTTTTHNDTANDTPQRRWSETNTDALKCDPLEMPGSRRPWGFKLKKPSFNARKPSDVGALGGGDGVIVEVCPPELCERLADCGVPVGGTAVLECALLRGVRHSTALWRKTSPDSRLLRATDRHSLKLTKEGVARLVIRDCRPSDAGTYLCSISNELGSAQTSCVLAVDGHVDDNKSPEAEIGDATWEQQQLFRRYEELNEIGRGRTSIVVMARDKGTDQRVALKQISLKQTTSDHTHREYKLLSSTQHPALPRALAIFRNAPSPLTDTIVMELVRGPHLFTYVIERKTYNDAMVADYSKQIISALDWLHSKGVAHLDIKPENIMIDVHPSTGQSQVKLIDLGCAASSNVSNVVLPPAPAHLEFAAPESVLGRPRGPYTDAWGLGVFLYVFLSGVSPFLDDSVEETTTNIVKCDFCFPIQHFECVGAEAQDLISSLLVPYMEQRPRMRDILKHVWFENTSSAPMRPTTPLQLFQQRRLPPSPPP